MPCNRGEHTRGGSAAVDLFIDSWDRRASPGRPPFLADAGARTFSNVRPASSIRLAFRRLAASTAAIDRAPSAKPQGRGAGSWARSRRDRLLDLYLQDFWPAKFLDQGIFPSWRRGKPRAHDLPRPPGLQNGISLRLFLGYSPPSGQDSSHAPSGLNRPSGKDRSGEASSYDVTLSPMVPDARHSDAMSGTT